MCKCNNCGYKFSRSHKQAVKGVGCGVCSGRTLVKGINDIPTTAPWMVRYFPGGSDQASNFTKSSGKFFIPICPFCGRLSDKKTSPNRLSKSRGISCICKDGITIPNKIIRGLMEQALNLGMIKSYEKEFIRRDEFGTLRKFDMFFCDNNDRPYFVEMDGGLHSYIKKKHSNNKFVAVSAKQGLSDLMKDNIANSLNIQLIRIDCYKSDLDYIKNNIYNSSLSAIIDLNKIDWSTIKRLCLSSIMIDVCNYKNVHPWEFASTVADVFHISSSTVRKYWKRGTVLGICNYDPKEEFNKRNALPRNWHNSVGIYIENLDSGENWEFKSISDFCCESETILDGDKITKSMLEKKFKQTSNDYIIYDSGVSEYLIWKSKKEK